MSQIKLLNGKVVVRSLPVLELPLAANAPTVKRLMLAQGELAQFYDADNGMRYLAFIELRSGTVRGNHYHKVKEEWLYVMRGEVVLVIEEIQSRTRESYSMKTGDLAIISTAIAHTLQVVSAGEAIECSSARFDPADIYKYHLVG